jgi:pyruvate formate lyase activating enzyme
VRTPIPNLIKAREAALGVGAEHVYLGNVFDTPFSDTFCNGCQTLLVSRYGLNANVRALDDNGHCTECGRDAHFKMRGKSAPLPEVPAPGRNTSTKSFDWHGDVRSLHVQARNTSARPAELFVSRRLADGSRSRWQVVQLAPSESFRFIVSQSTQGELGCEVAITEGLSTNLHEVFDRAHFPTVAVENVGLTVSDRNPLPLYNAEIRS